MVVGELQRRYGVAKKRCRMIPNGVDLERFRPDGRAEARRALGLEPNAPMFLFLGHGFERKGLDTALEALSLLSDDGAQLWVAGRDATAVWRARIDSLGLDRRVHLLGEREDTERLLAAADALMLPTRYDAFANVCLEAAASGCPVLTSAPNGAADWLGESCLCVPDPRDAAGFAKGLEELLDPTRRASLSRAGRSRAEESSWSHHVRALRELYREVAAQKSAPRLSH